MITGYCAKTQLQNFPTMQRVAILTPDSKEDGTRGFCENCGKEMFYKSPKFEDIISLACCGECSRELNFFSEYPEYVPTIKPDRYETYEEFIARRNAIEDERREKALQKEKELQKEEIMNNENEKNTVVENGQTEQIIKEETAVPKPKRGPCPVCGGPPYKRGWKHTEGCSNSAKAKLMKKTQ